MPQKLRSKPDVNIDIKQFREIHKDFLQGKLKDLNNEFELIQFQKKMLVRKVKSNVVCKNESICNALAPKIVNTIFVYQKQISDMILEDILTEEVVSQSLIERKKAKQAKI